MAPNCRSPMQNHYAHVDDWKVGVQANLIDDPSSRSDLPQPPRPATCPAYGPNCPAYGHNDMAIRSAQTRNCCRTTQAKPSGPYFPVGETEESFGETKLAGKLVKHMEYGYEASWRPSRVVVPVKDIMEPCVVTPAQVQFRPSIKVIDSGTGAWSEKWKTSKRHIDPGRSKDFHWRSCVKTSHPHKRGHEAEYKPQVRPDPLNSTLETNEGYFKPIRRHLIPYTPLRQKLPYTQKKHIIVPSEWVPPFRIQGEDYNTAPPKRFGKATVQEYVASHPPLSLGWGGRNRSGSAPSAIDCPGSPSGYMGHGASPFTCGPNGVRRNLRRYIPSGHLSHFENNNCCICKVGVGDSQRRTLRNQTASGPYHDTVPDRNPIVGDMPETDVLRHPRVFPGPALFGPAGSINSDIIDHKFSGLPQERTPVSEMKDQYRRWESIMENKS